MTVPPRTHTADVEPATECAGCGALVTGLSMPGRAWCSDCGGPFGTASPAVRPPARLRAAAAVEMARQRARRYLPTVLADEDDTGR